MGLQMNKFLMVGNSGRSTQSIMLECKLIRLIIHGYEYKECTL